MIYFILKSKLILVSIPTAKRRSQRRGSTYAEALREDAPDAGPRRERENKRYMSSKAISLREKTKISLQKCNFVGFTIWL